jgi:hypothetical protein
MTFTIVANLKHIKERDLDTGMACAHHCSIHRSWEIAWTPLATS